MTTCGAVSCCKIPTTSPLVTAPPPCPSGWTYTGYNTTSPRTAFGSSWVGAGCCGSSCYTYINDWEYATIHIEAVTGSHSWSNMTNIQECAVEPITPPLYMYSYVVEIGCR
jgi:hypothetical protein